MSCSRDGDVGDDGSTLRPTAPRGDPELGQRDGRARSGQALPGAAPASTARRTSTVRDKVGSPRPSRLARLGGGRFAIVCEARDDHAILALAASVTTALSRPVGLLRVGGLTCAASVGVALSGGEDAASLVRDASAAMRHASEHSGGH
ncbi:MAG: hypothetical protein ACYCTE_16695, partial [Acidimicrobiales bacterium]